MTIAKMSDVYNHSFKKELLMRIERIKSKKRFKKIFKIIKKHDSNYSKNQNGVFLNINALSDIALKELDEYLTKIEGKRTDETLTTSSMEYTPYSIDEFGSQRAGPRLSNQDKNILKRNRYANYVEKKEDDVVYRKFDTTLVTDSEKLASITSEEPN